MHAASPNEIPSKHHYHGQSHHPPTQTGKNGKKRKVFNQNQLESNIKREEVINKLRWHPQQRVHSSIRKTCWQHPFPHIPNTQTHPWSKAPVPKPSSQKPGSLSLNSWTSTVPFETFTSKTPKPSTWRVQYIRNLPLSDGNLRNLMCERRLHGQPGNQEARRVESPPR